MIVPMKKLTAVTLIENESELLESLGWLGVIQLQRLDDSEFVSFRAVTVEELRKCEIICELLRSVERKLGVSPKGIKKEHLEFDDSRKAIKDLRARASQIEEFEKKVVFLDEQVDATISRLNELKEAKPALRILQKHKVNPKDLGDFSNIFVKAGVAKSKLMPFLRFRLKSGEFVTFREATISPNETFIHITGLMELKPWINRLLASVEFREFKLPKELTGEIDKDVKWVDDEIKELEKKIERLKQDLRLTQAVSECSRNICSARSYLLKSKSMIMLQGWIPEDRIKGLDASFKKLNEELGGTIHFSYEDPLPDEEAPTVMKNPKLFGAYEVLTRQFGCPDRKESDPTIISTFLWITMFGIMFPDFGQGLAILGLGLAFTYLIKRPLMGMNFSKLGRLMIGLGASAAIFGLLTGEFFLTEFPPLWPGLMIAWVKYPNNVIWLIKIAVFFGIAQIFLGLIISIKNHLKAGEKMEALLGDRGLAGLITFVGVVIVASEFLGISLFPGIAFPELKLGVLSHWTIAIPFAGVAAITVKTIMSGEGATMIIGVVFEILTSCLANVLSYARIAGFCIAHATFALIVAKLFHADPMLGIGLGLIFLNIFALTLELMVVMIQSLRLLYYEFSTKFFKGTGTPFTPYRIEV